MLRVNLYCIVTRKLKSYVEDFNLRVTATTEVRWEFFLDHAQVSISNLLSNIYIQQ